MAAAAFSVGVGFLPGNDPEYTDAALILLIVIANGIFGFVQDYRAQKALEALRQMSSPETRVLRDGKKITLEAAQVVPGDIVLIDQGNRIPADARLIECESLETMEAALTGESANVAKQTEAVDKDAPLAERTNMVFMNTEAVKGRAVAVVVATGMKTEVGAIASEIEEAEDRETPFEGEVNRMGKRMGYGILVLIAVVGLVEYFFTSAGVVTTIMVAITLAVAAVPEGLPAVVTLTLALGSQKMARQKALVRQLPVVESLGSIDVIVTDKTGTLTENQMTVTRLYTSGEVYDVTGEGTSTEGEFLKDAAGADVEALRPLLECGAVANDAEPAPESEEEDYYGDPTEVALLVAAAKAGIEAETERVREIPFSSDRKRMTVIVADEQPVAYMKGAPEVVLERCEQVWRDGEAKDLDDAGREEILEQNAAFADQAFRVLACARKHVDDPEADDDAIESGMVFLGLQAMIDPPRAEVHEAVEDCRSAGIRVIMVTGDNLATAKAIGREIGFDPEGAMTGNDVDEMSEEEIREAVERTEVFARVNPHHKVKLLQALQEQGHRVAMTGDGVNDAPALRNADVGVAMGTRGTDVAKEASDMVLQDDNFVTLRNAIAEGRGIFDNIRKFVNYLLSANAGEILVVFFGVLVGSTLFPGTFGVEKEALILTPAMLLWINLVTDGLPALALGADPRMKNIMKRPPRPPEEPVINRRVIVSIIAMGSLMAIAGLPLYFYVLHRGDGLVRAQTLLLTFLVLAEMTRIQIIRARYHQSILSNRWLLAAVGSSVVLHLLVIYTPINTFFGVIPITLSGWAMTAIALVAFTVLSIGFYLLYESVRGRGESA